MLLVVQAFMQVCLNHPTTRSHRLVRKELPPPRAQIPIRRLGTEFKDGSDECNGAPRQDPPSVADYCGGRVPGGFRHKQVYTWAARGLQRYMRSDLCDRSRFLSHGTGLRPCPAQQFLLQRFDIGLCA